MSDWISVKDRMPKSEDWVNIWDGCYVSTAFFCGDGWSIADDMMKPDPDPVTHWMPLPDPPKVEEIS